MGNPGWRFPASGRSIRAAPAPRAPASRTRSLSLWLRFALANLGCFYAAQILSLVVHEGLGHGGAMLLAGAPSVTISVHPGLFGYAYAGEGYDQAFEPLVHYGGIAANLLAGLSALALLRFRRPALTALAFPLFWLAATETGHALAYSLQGLLLGQGDAARARASIGAPRAWLLGALVALPFLALVWWALGTLVRFARDRLRRRLDRARAGREHGPDAQRSAAGGGPRRASDRMGRGDRLGPSRRRGVLDRLRAARAEHRDPALARS